MEKKRIAVPLVCHGHSRSVVDLFYSPVTPDAFFSLVSAKTVALHRTMRGMHFVEGYFDIDHMLIKMGLYLSGSDSSPMLRNGETGDWIGTFEGHQGAVWSVCLDTNALSAASGSTDFTAYDTHLLLTGGVEKVLCIYDLNHPDAPPREVDKSPGLVRTVVWMHSDQTILSSCTDMGGVRLWDVRSGKIVQTLPSSVTSAEVSQDGRYITTVDGSTVKVWDASHFGLVKSYNMPCTVESASLEPKYGNKFIAGGEDMWVHVFDFHTGDEIDRPDPLMTHDDTESFATNGSVVKVKVSTEEVSPKIEGFHIAEEGKTKEKEAGNE
ncbi:hypothetical protein CRYUN_Cryun26dG0073200 [Craigia yunnanensis]